MDATQSAVPQAEARPSRARLPGMSRTRRRLITAGSLVMATLLWELLGRHTNAIFGSYPSAVFAAAIDPAASGQLLPALLESLESFGAGYLLAVLVGVPLGLVIGRFAFMEAAFGVYVTAGYAMPLVALVPLLALWLGLGFTVKMAIVFLMALFPVCINTWLGVKSVPKSLIDVGVSFVASDFTILRGIVLPASGLRLAIGKAVMAMIIAEFFTALSGLGAIIINSANNFDTAAMFVPILLLMVLATALTALERLVAPWQSEIAGRDGA